MIGAVGRFLIRTSAFLGKEVANILRQPRLIAMLVLGPFLILLIFGIGFQDKPSKLRTLFVVEDDNVLKPYIEHYATTLGPQIIFEGITEDRAKAMDRLQAGDVDALVVVPSRPLEKLRNNEPIVLQNLHNEIMPTEAGYVEFTMAVYVNVLNQRVLANLIENEQQEIEAIRTSIRAAQREARSIRDALTGRDLDRAQESIAALDKTLQTISPTVQTVTETQWITESLGSMGGSVWVSGTLSMLGSVQRSVQTLSETNLQNVEEQAETLAHVEANLADMDAALAALQRLESVIVTSPFRSQTQSVTPVEIETIDYYTPAVIALLLQHLCVTFGALSIVQEELIGAMELFKVAPISAFEMLLGKYLSYLLFNSLITALLSLLLIYGLNVPMVGNWRDYAITLLSMMFASLGLGFLISILAKSTSQAVQVSMLLLLSSVFFTGFMQGLESLRRWTRVISWSLPATYGMELLKNIMLRGRSLRALLVGGMIAMGGGLFLLNWILLPRRMTEA
ncbi:MAG: ABC transporter permease [Anaerolineae bacterium]